MKHLNRKKYVYLTVGYSVDETRVLKVFNSLDNAKQLAGAINTKDSVRYKQFDSASAIKMPVSGLTAPISKNK